MSIRDAILTLKSAKKKVRRNDYPDIDPRDINPETGRPYAGYSSPSLPEHGPWGEP